MAVDTGERPRRARRAGTGAAVVLAALLATAPVAGCTATNPQLTAAEPAPPADGQVVRLGDGIVVSSLHVITRAEGEAGVLLARVTNTSDQARRVSFTAPNLDQVVTVPAHGTAEIGGVEPDSTAVVIDPVTEAPGFLLPVEVAVQGGTTQQVRVPVMDGTFEYYEPYLQLPSS